ncbi:putative NADP-dependent oxidoreductase domain-containing protein [Medicago truncatula]|uniref:Aldo/keto reductase family oxidoreductase, putative n=1 Tax=Medicago truncatula TaxID=3880 RepID=G7JLX6_MEDTR|nr:aldo/keto reductase family oxidoreductase, putative [Medicago truncatula]RHN58764.1 putative NADP-dependent oxidoreductase domain-containing protein [Medicago truncatula]
MDSTSVYFFFVFDSKIQNRLIGRAFFDLLQIHWPDRYVALFGEYSYDPSKWRPSVPFVEQLQAFQELINEGKLTDS